MLRILKEAPSMKEEVAQQSRAGMCWVVVMCHHSVGSSWGSGVLQLHCDLPGGGIDALG